MRYSILFSLLIVTFVHQVTIADQSKQPPGAKVLSRLVGTWDVDVVSEATKWTPEKKQFKESRVSKFILGGQFLEVKIRNEDSTGRIIFHYDAKKKNYQFWFFSSRGLKSTWTGTWNDKTATMTWSSDLGIGVDAKSSIRFINKDKYKTKLVVKSSEGELLLDRKTENNRKKKSKSETAKE